MASRKWHVTGLMALAIVAVMATAAPADSIWDGGDGSWGTATKWTPDGVPGSAAIVRFDMPSATTTWNVAVDGNYTMDTLKFDYVSKTYTNGSTRTLNLVGTGSASSSLAVGSLYAGWGTAGEGYSNSHILNFSQMTLTVGTGSASVMKIGYNNEQSNQGTGGSLVAGADSVFNANVGNIILGINSAARAAGTGSLSVTNPTSSHTINVSSDIYLGCYDEGGGAGSHRSGGISLANGQTTVGGYVRIGYRSGADAGSRQLNGTMNLTNESMTVGTASAGKVLFGGEGTWGGWANNYARAYITASKTDSGLYIKNTTSTGLYFECFDNITVTGDYNANLLSITLQDPLTTTEGWYYGLRWDGDHVSTGTTQNYGAGTGLRNLLTGTEGRLLINITGLSQATKERHLLKLQAMYPATYGSKTWSQLVAADFIQYDSAIGATYVGYYYGPTEVPSPSLTITTAENLRVLAGGTIAVTGAVGNTGTGAYTVSGTVTQGVGGLTVSSVSPSPMDPVAAGGSTPFTAIVSVGATLGTQTYNLTVTDAATPTAHTASATHHVIVGQGVATADTFDSSKKMIANLFNDSDLDGLSSTVDTAYGATLLEGKALASGGAQEVGMNWRWPTSDERENDLLVTDVVDLTLDVTKLATLSGGGKYVLEMRYSDQDEFIFGNELNLAKAGRIFIAYKDSTLGWVNAGTHLVGLGVPANDSMTMSWSELGSSTTVGDWGVDTDADTVWVVLNHASEFAVVPEPATLAFLALGGLSMLGAALRRRRSA